MNAERLHAIVLALSQEMAENDVAGKLQELVNALQRVVQQPAPQFQNNLAASRTAIFDALTDTPSDRFSPTWRQILSEIGGEDFFGNRLKENIEAVFARNQITPAVASQELQELSRRVQEFKTALEQGISAFRSLKIGDETLAPGECEIGVLIPRIAVGTGSSILLKN